MFRKTALLSLLLLLFAVPTSALAHVKWFTQFSFADEPADLSDILDATFIGLSLLTMGVLAAATFIDRRLEAEAWYVRLDDWLSRQSENSRMIIRVAAGMVMLLAWQADSLMVPELTITQDWIGWLQFVIVLLLLVEPTVPLAGAGMIGLWLIGVTEYGLFYMLDYVSFVGAGYYLIVTSLDDVRIKGTGLPALYASLGISLIWVALEKIVYPQWGLEILRENQQLTLGLDRSFFLTSAAFVELALGYMLLIGLMSRPLALIITLVFFSTTAVFGKTEIIGHTLIHGMLIVFFLEGPGDVYKAPYTFHQRLPWRMAFVAVNFAVVLALTLVPYVAWAHATYEESDIEALFDGKHTIDEPATIDLAVEDMLEGEWAIEAQTDYEDGQIVLFLNEDRLPDSTEAMVTLESLPPGEYHVLAVLSNAATELLIYESHPIIAEEVFVVEE